MTDYMLEVEGLKKYFPTSKGLLRAVDNVSFRLERGTTLGIVGESGCGKSTLGRAILRLHEPTEGRIIVDGKDITHLSKKEMREMRRKMQIIFQDPYASLDPRQTVFDIIAEPLRKQNICKSREELHKRVQELMETAGLAQRLINSYPHELDGGRRQRIGIARALALEPQIIVCDEPVSALDVSIQAQVLNLLEDLQDRLGLTYIFITHDLSVVHHLADEIAVMYLGKVVEKAPKDELFKNPLHPYTKALLSAIPVPDLHERSERILLSGEVTSPINLPDHCRFCKRCYDSMECCASAADPPMVELENRHFVSCYHYVRQN